MGGRLVAVCLMALGLLVAGCGGMRQSAKPAQDAVRPPTPGERARIAFAVKDTWTYESEPLYSEVDPIARISPSPIYPPTVVFGNFGRLQLGTKTAVTIDIEDPGTNPVRYPVIFTRG